jgi:hypothetical protein
LSFDHPHRGGLAVMVARIVSLGIKGSRTPSLSNHPQTTLQSNIPHPRKKKHLALKHSHPTKRPKRRTIQDTPSLLVSPCPPRHSAQLIYTTPYCSIFPHRHLLGLGYETPLGDQSRPILQATSIFTLKGIVVR